MTAIEIGRLLRAGTTGFVVGCRVSQIDSPSFGALARVPLNGSYEIYGLIHDIHIDDDGLVRQLVTAAGVDGAEMDAVIADNRVNRNVPVEVSLLTVGYQQNGRIYHLLPPRPPLSLDVIYLCDENDLRKFTGGSRFGYFRHILRAKDLPVGELLAAHVRLAHAAHCAVGQTQWSLEAMQELIVLLRDDYPVLMSVLGALGDVFDE